MEKKLCILCSGKISESDKTMMTWASLEESSVIIKDHLTDLIKQ